MAINAKIHIRHVFENMKIYRNINRVTAKSRYQCFCFIKHIVNLTHDFNAFNSLFHTIYWSFFPSKLWFYTVYSKFDKCLIINWQVTPLAGAWQAHLPPILYFILSLPAFLSHVAFWRHLNISLYVVHVCYLRVIVGLRWYFDCFHRKHSYRVVFQKYHFQFSWWNDQRHRKNMVNCYSCRYLKVVWKIFDNSLCHVEQVFCFCTKF